MRLTVLGSSASYPAPGRACAGHLVQSGGTAILLDCGNGVLSNLGKLIDPTELSAVFVTHGHIDHFADIYALQAALRYAPSGPMPPLQLHVPTGLFSRMQAALGEHGASELASAFEVHELAAAHSVTVGGIRITPHPVEHVGEAYALVLEADGARLCYTSDTRSGQPALTAARNADLLLAEATLPPEYENRAPHMTPAQAGQLAQDAGARMLVMTHLWPTVDRTQAVDAAGTRFDGAVAVASELDTFDIDHKEAL